ncbi:MAG: hypothetical protein HC818_08070 [Synechococcaceae cyanobacterium RM1_1_27]|nr:hypothetical protein [Synechococcaceae cyanobacterium RM1_1_27]
MQKSELSSTQLTRKGRPRGKRSDPSFEQVTAYIPKELYRRVKLKILAEEGEAGTPTDFSELLADLLKEWLGDP